jgi:hypothetical protein
MQHLGQKKKKNGKSAKSKPAKSKSAVREPKKQDRSADRHAKDLIF